MSLVACLDRLGYYWAMVSDNIMHGNDAWIQNIIDQAKDIEVSEIEQKVIDKLIYEVYRISDVTNRRLWLAAAFDLLLSAEYYRTIAHAGWLYCPEHSVPLLLYPYTNACPRCVVQNKFVYHNANKPKSGSIGAKTSRLLSAFLQSLFLKNKFSVQVKKGVEPVDIVLIDHNVSPLALMFAEIKAAPLVTLPLAIISQTLTKEAGSRVTQVDHRVSDFATLYGTQLNIFLPKTTKGNPNWQLIPFGMRQDIFDEEWAYHSLFRLLSSEEQFLASYFQFWETALNHYEQKSQTDLFWLTNACGQPSPRPANWPRRHGASGHESISDSKSSVGMDRTDDLKKATYQVLKISTSGNPSQKFHFTAGIISNIHAIRHFDEYIEALKDVVWTHDETNGVQYARDLSPHTPLFNLFDGIVALTRTYTRDEWLAKIFAF